MPWASEIHFVMRPQSSWFIAVILLALLSACARIQTDERGTSNLKIDDQLVSISLWTLSAEGEVFITLPLLQKQPASKITKIINNARYAPLAEKPHPLMAALAEKNTMTLKWTSCSKPQVLQIIKGSYARHSNGFSYKTNAATDVSQLIFDELLKSGLVADPRQFDPFR